MPKKSTCIISISWRPDGANLWYFKLRLFDLTEFIVWNIKGLRHWVAKMALKNKNLLKKFISFRIGAITSPYILDLGEMTGVGWAPMGVFAAGAITRKPFIQVYSQEHVNYFSIQSVLLFLESLDQVSYTDTY